MQTELQQEPPESSGNGNGSGALQPAVAAAAAASSKDERDSPKHKDWVPDPSSLSPMQFTPLTNSERMWTNFRASLCSALEALQEGGRADLQAGGEIPDQLQGRFAPGFSLPTDL